jgi:hypothetical protein
MKILNAMFGEGFLLGCARFDLGALVQIMAEHGEAPGRD